MLNAPAAATSVTTAPGALAAAAARAAPDMLAVPGARALAAVPAAANGTVTTGAPRAVPSTWNEWLVRSFA